jgi:hypothetical protein
MRLFALPSHTSHLTQPLDQVFNLLTTEIAAVAREIKAYDPYTIVNRGRFAGEYFHIPFTNTK